MTTLERLLANPRAVLRALDCLDARESFHTFCGLVEIPTAPVEDDPDEDESPGAYRPPRKPTAAHLIELCDVLQAIDDGRVKRAMFFLPPGSAKSTYASVLFPPYFLGRVKGRTCIVATYGSEFARKLGRRARSVIQQRVFREIHGVTLDPASAAADEWLLTNGNEYMAGGIRSGIMGNRADLLVIDDPIKGREQAESDGVRESTRDAYQDDLLTRLKPGGAVIIVQCLTGDTQITLADGEQKRLDNITPGDSVLSWDGQKHVRCCVSAVIDNGNDQTFMIRTITGSVRANARHPFLVITAEGLRWVRTKDLRAGMRIVAHKRAPTLGRLAQSSGVTNQPDAEGCAKPTTTRLSGRPATERRPSTAKRAYLTGAVGGMGSIKSSSIGCSPSRAGSAQSASPTAASADPDIGSQTSSPTITTKQGLFAACYATTATGSRDELEIPPFWSVPSSTSEPDTDEVISIEPHGVERVYDLSVDGSRNFVANGLWTHNTRWHDADLAGSILPEDYDGQSGWVKCRDGKWWYIVSIPAQAERADDPLGRRVGQYIWPEWFGRSEPGAANPGEGHFAPFKLNPRTWASLFQQRPRPADGTYFQRDWFKRYEAGREHPHLNRYITSDHAPGGQADSDFSCVRVWGIDPEGDIWLLDGFRHQATMDVTADLVVGDARNPSRSEHEPIVEGLIRKHRPFAWFPEDDNNWKAVAGFVQRRLREEGVHCRVEPVSPHGRDKAAKAQSFQGMAASGRVWLPLTPAGEDVLSEYLKFPTGAHDDEVDAAGIIGRVIDEAHPAIVPTTRGPEVRRRYSKKKPASVWAS